VLETNEGVLDAPATNQVHVFAPPLESVNVCVPPGAIVALDGDSARPTVIFAVPTFPLASVQVSVSVVPFFGPAVYANDTVPLVGVDADPDCDDRDHVAQVALAVNVCVPPGERVTVAGLSARPTVIFEMATFPLASVHFTVSVVPPVDPAVYVVVVDPPLELNVAAPLFAVSDHALHASLAVSVVDAPGATVAVAGVTDRPTVIFATAMLPFASVHFTVSSEPAVAPAVYTVEVVPPDDESEAEPELAPSVQLTHVVPAGVAVSVVVPPGATVAVAGVIPSRTVMLIDAVLFHWSTRRIVSIELLLGPAV
jgi:hypothetical protein